MKNSLKMKKTIMGLGLGASLLTTGAALGGPTHPTFGTFVNASAVPYGATMVLDITYKVTNDEDSGYHSFWALDNYNREVQVWQDPVDSTLFYVVSHYAGSWTTFKGALSPGAGVTQTADGSGTFQGGYFATFNASGFTSAFGNLGTFDFGGTKADILLDSYSLQTGPTTVFDWLGTYFPTAINFGVGELWGWTYHYPHQTWNNFYYLPSGSGDILTH